MATEHQYHPLDASKNEIRVVRLTASSNFTAKASCRLIHLSLDDNITYEALSYTWGSPTSKRTIFLDGQKFLVTRNLEIALRHLRYVKDERYLWIDALCINQESVKERNQQVRKMGEIYKKATKVVVWLGPASEDSNIGMDFLVEACARRLEMRAWISEVIMDLGLVENLKAAIKLLQRDYWRRVWIIQEMFFAKSLIVRCGFRCIRWSDFIFLALSLSKISPSLVGMMVESVDEDILVGALKKADLGLSIANLQNRAVLPLYIEECRKKAEHAKGEYREPLTSLLMMSRNSLSGDPCDKVFGIVGMAEQYNNQYALKIDYSLDTRETYIETARALLVRSENFSATPLDIICMSKPHLSNGSLPSWVPDWSAPLSRTSYAGIQSEFQFFKANGVSPPKPTIKINLDVLTVRAIQIATIDHLGAKVLPVSNIPSMSLLDLAKLTFGTETFESVFFADRTLAMSTSRDVPHSKKPLGARMDEFTRTLVLNHDMVSLTANSVVFEALSKEDVQKFSKEVIGRINPGEKLTDYLSQIKDRTTVSFLARVLDYLRKLRFCVSSDGSFVMGPPLICKGDLVCVLFGCNIPVILREIGENQYAFCGECYVHGIMDGEAIEGMRAGIYKAKEFRIY